MNVAEINERVQAVMDASHNDDGVAHSMEDDLHRDVLRAIARGQCEDPRGCAEQALLTAHLKFTRGCA